MHIDIPKGTIIKGFEEIDEKDLILQEDLKIPIKVKISYEIDYDELNVFLSDYDIAHLKEEFLLDLKSNYMLYGKHDEKLLTEKALKLKYRILEVLKEKNCDSCRNYLYCHELGRDNFSNEGVTYDAW